MKSPTHWIAVSLAALFLIACSVEEEEELRPFPYHNEQQYSLIYEEDKGRTVFMSSVHNSRELGLNPESKYMLIVNGQEALPSPDYNESVRMAVFPGEVNEVAFAMIYENEQFTYKLSRKELELLLLNGLDSLYRTSMDSIPTDNRVRNGISDFVFVDFLESGGATAFSYVFSTRFHLRDTASSIFDTVSFWQMSPPEDVQPGTYERVIEHRVTQEISNTRWSSGRYNEDGLSVFFTYGTRYRAGTAEVLD